MREYDNPSLIIVPPNYVSAVLKLHEKLDGKNIDWALSGDFGEALRTVRVTPDCIEIVASKDAAYQIHCAVSELIGKIAEDAVEKLPRNALVQGKEYPVYIRSLFFEFAIDEIKVKVYGGLQYKVGEWDWGDTFQFTPDVVNVAGKKTFVVPLNVKFDLYQSLGWSDRAESISKVFSLQEKILNRTLNKN